MRKKKLFTVIILYILSVATLIPGLILTVGYSSNLSISSRVEGADVTYSYSGDKVTIWDYGYSEYRIDFYNGDYAIVSDPETCKDGDYLTFIFDNSIYSINGYDGEYEEVSIYSKQQIYEIVVTSNDVFDHVLIYTLYSQYYLGIEDMLNGDYGANTAYGYIYIGESDFITETMVYINNVYYTNSSTVEYSNYDDDGVLIGGIILSDMSFVFLIAAIVNTVQYRNNRNIYSKEEALRSKGVNTKGVKLKQIETLWQQTKDEDIKQQILSIVQNNKPKMNDKYIACEYCGAENEIDNKHCDACGAKLRRL